MRVLVIAATLSLGAAWAQQYTSPPAQATTRIHGKEFKVDYFSPGMHGRKIYGNVVRWDWLWSIGANRTSVFITPFDIHIGSLDLPKGTYSIWAIPNETEWTLTFNKQWGQGYLEYDEDEDLGDTKMTVRVLKDPVENLTIEVKAEGDNGGRLVISWENTEASAPFTISEQTR